MASRLAKRWADLRDGGDQWCARQLGTAASAGQSIPVADVVWTMMARCSIGTSSPSSRTRNTTTVAPNGGSLLTGRPSQVVCTSSRRVLRVRRRPARSGRLELLAVEEGWQRRHPHVQLDREAIRNLLGTPGLDAEVLSGGLRNTNYRLRLAGEPRPVVLRLYTAEAAACAREVALMRLVGEHVRCRAC